ncbi:MAG: MerR family DNA-binding transcriptional regulator [Inquilinus sp.]|nr:MerR family DNA-binding transcriptional regulator [Inquilinus sp.]
MFPDQILASDDESTDSFTISELAADFDLTPRTIRFYEDEGLLTPLRDGLVRIYSRRDRGRLALICRGKRLGFSLAEIKEFLDLYNRDKRQVEQMRFAATRARDRIKSLEGQLADVQQTLEELRAIEGEMSAFLRRQGVAPEQGQD